MIYLHGLKLIGLTEKEATNVMQTLYKSELHGKTQRVPGTAFVAPVKTYDRRDAIAFLKTKQHLDHVAKFLRLAKVS